MENELIILYENKLIINNVTKLIEYNSKIIKLEINKINYIILGNNILLENVYNNNTKIEISGEIFSISRNHKINNKSFIKRVFS